MHLAHLAARDVHLADAVNRLDPAPDLLVGDLGQRAETQRTGKREAEDRVVVGVYLRDHRRPELRREILHRLRRLLADVLGRVVDVALEHELDRDLRDPFAQLRRHLVDPGDAAERLFGRLDDGAVQLVGARAGQRQGDGDGRGIGFRQEIDAEVAERKDPRHHKQHHEHRGEHGTADAEFR